MYLRVRGWVFRFHCCKLFKAPKSGEDDSCTLQAESDNDNNTFVTPLSVIAYSPHLIVFSIPLPSLSVASRLLIPVGGDAYSKLLEFMWGPMS